MRYKLNYIFQKNGQRNQPSLWFHLWVHLHRTSNRHGGCGVDNMVKGIYTYRKDHTAESMVFSPWSRTIIPFSSLCRKIQAFQDESKQTSAWNKSHGMPYLFAQPQPKHGHTLGKTRTGWSNWRNWFNLIKTEQ